MYVCTHACAHVYMSVHMREHVCTCMCTHACVCFVCVLVHSFHALPGTLQPCLVLCFLLGRASQSAGGDGSGFQLFPGVCTAVYRLWGSLELHTAPVGTPSPELPLSPLVTLLLTHLLPTPQQPQGKVLTSIPGEDPLGTRWP